MGITKSLALLGLDYNCFPETNISAYYTGVIFFFQVGDLLLGLYIDGERVMEEKVNMKVGGNYQVSI